LGEAVVFAVELAGEVVVGDGAGDVIRSTATLRTPSLM